ncbi:uncharacterized protein [Populus alba]|uniref:uncharacterized protein isoform X2 n=1 Tax=Populus alba TaxID=43335 RepID=UPI003CC6EF33
MFRARQTLARIKLTLQSKQFCSSTTKPNNNNNKSISEKTDSKVSKYEEASRQLDNLDFMKAAKILFSDPPKKKKFGIDFHLELEKKKKEEEEKAKEEELKAIEEKAQSESELLEVKERLGKLEEVVKEIAVESKKQSGGSVTKTQVQEDSSETVKQKSLGPASIPDSSPQDQKGETQNEGTSPDAKR